MGEYVGLNPQIKMCGKCVWGEKHRIFFETGTFFWREDFFFRPELFLGCLSKILHERRACSACHSDRRPVIVYINQKKIHVYCSFSVKRLLRDALHLRLYETLDCICRLCFFRNFLRATRNLALKTDDALKPLQICTRNMAYNE